MFSGNSSVQKSNLVVGEEEDKKEDISTQSMEDVAAANALAELQINPNDRKKKSSAIIDTDDYIGLYVWILKADGIEERSQFPYNFTRNYYNVVYWVNPNEELRTKMSDGANPIWNHVRVILLKKGDIDLHNSFLKLEVLRVNCSEADPGTSSGNVVVGRARIPFPTEFDVARGTSYPLIRFGESGGCRVEGNITVSLRLEKVGSNHSGMCKWF